MSRRTGDGAPQAGVLVVFEAPSESSSAIFAGGNTVVTDINSHATLTVTASMQGGSDMVTAHTSPTEVTPDSIQLHDTGWLYLPIVIRQWTAGT